MQLVSIGDVGTAIVLDGSNVWVAGLTASTNFPVSATPFESTNDAEVMAGPPATTGFISELTPSSTSGLSQIDYSTYFGGTGYSVSIPILGTFGTGDAIGAMAESGGKVYVTGLTTSASALETGYTSTFPLSSNKCQAANNSSGISLEGFDVPVTAFVSELNPSLAAASQLVFSTLLGGSGMADIGLGLAFNGTDIFVVGSTYSTDFPVTSNGYQIFNNDFNTADSEQSTAAFLTEINPAGNTCPTPFVKEPPTPTATPTGATATPTATGTIVSTGTATPTATKTATGTATATATAGTPTATSTATRTATATATATSTGGTPTATATATKTATATATATSTGGTPTATATATKTATATPTATATGATPTATATATRTATATATGTATPTPTATATPLGTLSFKPDPVSFGDKAKLNKKSKKEVTIKNTDPKHSGIDVMITGETTTGAPFAVAKQCIKTLAPGKSCKVEVTFTPTDSSPQSGDLIINDNASGAPQMVPLSGTGK